MVLGEEFGEALECGEGFDVCVDQLMHGTMAAGAEHGEVLGLRFADAAGQGDAVVGFDQVKAGVFLLWDGAAGLADNISGLGALTGQFLG